MVLKKGLLVGINYIGTSSELSGCINDTQNLKELLKRKKYLKNSDMTFMNDNQKGGLYPTKQNIINQLQKLVDFANAHKDDQVFLFFSYSGHGHYLRDKNGDEDDGRDEVLCPVDYTKNGFIVDDYLKNNIVDKLSDNVTFVVLIDACHSGTMLDLKYNFNNLNQCKINNKVTDAKCDVVMISGCRDNQTSADAYIYDSFDWRKEYQGAMTAAFIKCYSDGISYKDLISKMRTWLSKKKYTQIPQLSSGKNLDIDTNVLLATFKH